GLRQRAFARFAQPPVRRAAGVMEERAQRGVACAQLHRLAPAVGPFELVGLAAAEKVELDEALAEALAHDVSEQHRADGARAPLGIVAGLIEGEAIAVAPAVERGARRAFDVEQVEAGPASLGERASDRAMERFDGGTADRIRAALDGPALVVQLEERVE